MQIFTKVKGREGLDISYTMHVGIYQIYCIQGQGNQCQTPGVKLEVQLESPEKFLRKSFESPVQVVRKS